MRDEKILDSIRIVQKQGKKILEMEEKLKALKEDPEFKNAMNCLKVASSIGIIDLAPGKKNGYQSPTIIRHTDGTVRKIKQSKKS